MEDFSKGRGKSKTTLWCINCYPDRKAKKLQNKGLSFTTKLSTFYGLNRDANNFFFYTKYNKPKDILDLPICDICFSIYLCYPISLIPLKKGDEVVYYFINSDGSLVDLLKENNLFEQKLNQDVKGNIFLDFFTEIVLQVEREKTKYHLQNIAVLEIDLNNENIPKVHSFNISWEKAEFLFKRNINKYLKKLAHSYYVQEINKRKKKLYILQEAISLIIKNKLDFYYLYKLIKLFLEKQLFNIYPHNIQELNVVIVNFSIQVIGGLSMEAKEKIRELSEGDLWNVYKRGKELGEILKKSKDENKIVSIAYKLLNSLRIENTKQFMDLLIRTHISYKKEIPQIFIKAIEDKETLLALGYSFLTGFISEIDTNNEEENKEGKNEQNKEER